MDLPNLPPIKVGDLFDLTSPNQDPTTYQIRSIDSTCQKPNLLINFELYHSQPNPLGQWDLLLTPQGEKIFLQFGGEYQMSDFYPSTLSADFLSNLSDDIVKEIVLQMKPSDFFNFCKTSQRMRKFYSAEDEFFWRRKLDIDFPNRIQKESPKLGWKGYYIWLWTAQMGKIKPRLTQPEYSVLKFESGQILSLTFGPFTEEKFRVIIFDRFGYYPQYLLELEQISNQSRWNVWFLGFFDYDTDLMVKFELQSDPTQLWELDFQHFLDQVIIFDNYLEYYAFEFWPHDDGCGIIWNVFLKSFWVSLSDSNDLYGIQVADPIPAREELKIFQIYYRDRKNRDPKEFFIIDVDPDQNFSVSRWENSPCPPRKLDPEENEEVVKIVNYFFQAHPEFVGRVERWLREKPWEQLDQTLEPEAIERLKALDWL